MVFRRGFFLPFLTVVGTWYFCLGVAPYFKYRTVEPDRYEKNGTNEVRLKCIVEADTAEYRWYKDGRLLSNNAKYRMKRLRNLKIRNVVFADQGLYRCEASNIDGSISKSVKLIITGAVPNITENGKAPSFQNPVYLIKSMVHKVSAGVGSPAIFSCEADGDPTPSIQWLMDGRLINRPNDRFSFSGRYTMKIKVAGESDIGKYRCVVSNQYGNISADFVLEVVDKIRSKPILHPITNKTVIVHTDITIKCEAVDKTLPEFKFYKQEMGNRIRIDQNVTQKIEKGEEKGAHSWSFKAWWTLKNVSFADQTLYTCEAKNIIGINEESFFITVLSIRTESQPKATMTPLKNKRDYKLVLIVGIAVAVSLLFLTIIISSIWLCARRRRRRGKADLMCRELDGNDEMLLPGDLPNTSSNIPPSRPKTRGRLQSNLSQTSEIPVPYDEEWEISRENILLLEVIGEGAFGKVLRAEAHDVVRFNSVRTTVAVKTLKDDATEVEFADLVSELEVMKTIGPHKNIINLVGCCTRQNGPLFMVVEFAPYGSLRDFLRERRPNREGTSNSQYAGVEEVLTLRDFISFSYQVARGMEYLASMKCIHRDLAARNVLVCSERVMKIADFGLARDIHKIDYYRKTTDGRLPVKWMALEALFDRVYTTQSDVWAFGILTWEIFTFGGTPYPSVPLEKLFELLKSGYRMERPVNCPPELYDLLLRCWLEDPNSRPNFAEVVKELNKELESMTNEEYIELLSPMTPRSPSESDPHRGLDVVRRSYCDSKVFDSEENGQVEDEDEEDEVLVRKERKDCESGDDDPVELSDGELSEASAEVFVNSADGTSTFRGRLESHV